MPGRGNGTPTVLLDLRILIYRKNKKRFRKKPQTVSRRSGAQRISITMKYENEERTAITNHFRTEFATGLPLPGLSFLKCFSYMPALAAVV
jgi:hypothetical protein